MLTCALSAVVAVAYNTSAAIATLANKLAGVALSALLHATLLLTARAAAAATTAYARTAALEHLLGITSNTCVHRSAVSRTRLTLV